MYRARHRRFLEAIYDLDQGMRLKVHIDITPEKIAGFEAIDIANQRRMTWYLKRHGWPDQGMLGEKACLAAFLVIQYAPKTYIESHIAYLRDGVCAGKARHVELAAMQDRLLLYRGKKQLYGTQYQREAQDGLSRFRAKPIVNPSRVDQRRKKAGFTETLAESLDGAMGFVESITGKA